jgi:hypothetical protein
MVKPLIQMNELRSTGKENINPNFTKSTTESTECFTKVSEIEESDEDYSNVRI